MIELTLAPPVQPAESEEPARSGVMLPGELNQTPPAGRPGASTEPPARRPVHRSPVPDADALARAEKQIRYLFEAEFESTRTADEKKALADRLFQVAREVDDDSAAHYVLCRVTRDLAVEVGDPDAFCRFIDEMDWRYQIDALAMKAEAMAEAWRSKDSVPYRAALAEHSLRLLDAAMTAKHYAAAEQLVRVAQNAARASKDYGLMRELEDRARQIKAAQQTAR